MSQQRRLFLLLACSAVFLVNLVVHATGVLENTILNSVRNHQKKRKAQEDEPYDPCTYGDLISGYSVYNADSNTSTALDIFDNSPYPRSIFTLEDYPNKKLNIIVHTINNCTSKPIGCVKISFGDIKTTYEKRLPYTLFGDNPFTGKINVEKLNRVNWQLLQAWTYPKSDCTGDSTSYSPVDILVVPRTTNAIAVKPIVAIYQNTAGPVSYADTKAVVDATCDYIHVGLDNNLFYKSNVVVTKFKCWNMPPASVNYTVSPLTPLVIVYKFFVGFRVEIAPNPYTMELLPNRAKITNHIHLTLTDMEGRTPNSLNLSSIVKEIIGSSNPYSTYSKITFP